MIFPVNDEPFLDAKFVCNRLGISRKTLGRLVKRGELGGFLIGRNFKTTRRDLHEFLSGARIDRAYLSKKR